jgi:hypothetical protein
MNMRLTPEQQLQLQEAKAAGQQRVNVRLTAEQKQAYRAAVAEEHAGKGENIAHIRKIQAAAQQPGFFGDVRRAIAACRRPVDELAKQIGVDARLLSDFRAAEAELPPAVLDRLIESLGLRLMQEIRR